MCGSCNGSIYLYGMWVQVRGLRAAIHCRTHALVAFLRACRYLSLSNNLLVGMVPSTLSALTTAITSTSNFDFSYNGLHGSVPAGVAARFSATNLSWAGNCITGATSRPTTCDFVGREALMDLYAGTAGWDWIYSNSWGNFSGTPCAWYGVTCNSSGTVVVSIDLSGNNLVGLLPDSIGALTGLTYVPEDAGC